VDGIERIKELNRRRGQTIHSRTATGWEPNPVKQAANAQWESQNEAKACLMAPATRERRPCRAGSVEWLQERRIHDLEHHRRLSTPSMTNVTAQELEAVQRCWVATECERLEPQLSGRICLRA
jgi:hypothetical protein